MSESGFHKTTRLGIERSIREAFESGDMQLTNYHLDLYPTGRPRPEMSLELARHVAQLSNIVELRRVA